MKVFILACVILSTAVYSEVFYKSLRFCDCGDSGWRINEYSVAWDRNDTLITMNVIYKTGDETPEFFRQVHVNISGCQPVLAQDCSNSTTVHVSNVNCLNTNITSMDRETCDVAMMIAEHQLHRLLLPPFLRFGGVCICGANDELTANGGTNDSDSSEESVAPNTPINSTVSEVSLENDSE